MSTSQALNDGGAAATPKKEKKPKDAKAEKKPKDATAEKTRDKKKKGKDKDKEKKPKLSDEEKAAAKEAKAAEKAAEKALKAEEKAAAKAAEKEAKAAEKAAAKEAKKAEKKAAAAAIVAYSQPGSDDIALASHAQRPAVPKLALPPMRPNIDAMHDAIRARSALEEAEQQTADAIASIHEHIANYNIDGSRSITRHIISHVREHQVELQLEPTPVPEPVPEPEPTGCCPFFSSAVQPADGAEEDYGAQRFADDAPTKHKVAHELYSQAALLWRPVLINNAVRQWEVHPIGICKKGRCPGCRMRCKKFWCGCFRRSRHLLSLYAFVIFALSCALALVDNIIVPIAVLGTWALPGLWTPAVLIKACSGCKDTHGNVTLEWRVQAVFWFGLWLLPALIFFAPIVACVHGGGSPIVRWLGLGVSLGSLWTLGWIVNWVQTVAQGVDKTGHDRYRSIAAAYRDEEADAEAERVRKWPRQLPYGFASRKVSTVFEGLFLCSVAFLPTMPWGSIAQPEVLPAAVTDRLRPDLIFRVFILDAAALTELVGVKIPFLHLGMHGLVLILALLCPLVIKCFQRKTKDDKEAEELIDLQEEQMLEVVTPGKKKKGGGKRPATPKKGAPPTSVLTHRVLSIFAQTKTTTYFCEMLAFPILLHIFEPFVCTDLSVLAATTNDTCTCTTNVTCQCMDANPEMECWTMIHMGAYVLPSLFVLPAYYFCALRGPSHYLRKQTLLDINPAYLVTSFQLKVLLAAVTVAFRSQPYIVIGALEAYAIALLWMTRQGRLSCVFALTWLVRVSLLWPAMYGGLAAYLLVSEGGGLVSDLGLVQAVGGCLVLPWLLLYSRVRCCWKRPVKMAPGLGHKERAELVDYPIIAARWSAYQAILEDGRLEVAAARQAVLDDLAAVAAAKVVAAEEAMKRAAELFSGKRVLRECFFLWKMETKKYDDTVWKGLLQVGTIDFKVFKEMKTLEGSAFSIQLELEQARKEYMSEHEKELGLKGRSEQTEKEAKQKAEDEKNFFTSKWSQTLKGKSIVVSAMSGTTALQSGAYTSVWCDDPLPATGKHYWEIQFEQPGAKPGDFVVRDAYFIGVVNHTNTEENGAGFSRGSWGLVPYNDGRALRANGMDAGALAAGCRNKEGNIFGAGDRIGVLADMDAKPRTLQFYRDQKSNHATNPLYSTSFLSMLLTNRLWLQSWKARKCPVYQGRCGLLRARTTVG